MQVYTLSCPKTGEIRYVGISKVDNNSRYRDHVALAKRQIRKNIVGTNKNENWIRSLVIRGLLPVYEPIAFFETQQEIWDAERAYIAEFKQRGFNLNNHQPGGEGFRPPTKEEVRKRMVESQRKRRASETPEERKRQASALVGVKRGPRNEAFLSKMRGRPKPDGFAKQTSIHRKIFWAEQRRARIVAKCSCGFYGLEDVLQEYHVEKYGHEITARWSNAFKCELHYAIRQPRADGRGLSPWSACRVCAGKLGRWDALTSNEQSGTLGIERELDTAAEKYQEKKRRYKCG